MRAFFGAVGGVLLGALIGLPIAPVARDLFLPTEIRWDATACGAGHATVVTTAISATGDVKMASQVLTFPIIGEIVQPMDLRGETYTVTARVVYDDGRTVSSEMQTVLGLGEPVPSPTPTPSPSPTPTPTPTPIPGVPSPDGSIATVPSGSAISSPILTDALLHAWSIEWGWTMRDGAYSWQPSGDLGASADKLKIVGGILYAHDPRYGGAAGTWAKWNEAAQPSGSHFFGAWTDVGPIEPGQTPTVDLSPILTKMDQQTAALLAAIESLKTPAPTPSPIPTCPATISSLSAPYANGDYRLTVRVPVGCIKPPVAGQAIQIVK